MLGEPLFCWGVGLGLAMLLGQFPPNVAVGLPASVRVLYARNLYYSVRTVVTRVVEGGEKNKTRTKK